MPSNSPCSAQPATLADIAAAITPCLVLVAPVGMDQEMQATWTAAAFKALAGYRLGDIQDGAREAMRHADHPSKIVPLIVRAIEARPRYVPLAANIGPSPIALPKHDVQAEAERSEVAALMAGLAKKLSMKHD